MDGLNNDDFLASVESGGFGTNAAPQPLPDNVGPQPLPRHEANLDGDDGYEDDFVPREKFDSLDPDVQRALKVRARELRKHEKQLERAEARIERLQELAMNGQKNNSEEPKKEGWARYQDSELNQYLSDADAIQKALLEDPTNEAVRAEASKINPAYLRAVQEEMVKRKLTGEMDHRFGELKQKESAREQAANLAALAERQIRTELGADALMRTDSPMMERAREIYSEMSEQYGISDDSPGAAAMLSVMAMRQANQEVNRGGERRSASPNLLRSLDIEGRGRTESSVAAERSAAQRRGDWDGVLAHDINDMLKGMGL